MSETIAYIGIGSNLADRRRSISRAISMLDGSDGVKVIGVSDTIETEPLGAVDQPQFLNAVAKVETSLSAEQFFGGLLSIESALGRVQKGGCLPRVIDLDLLLFGSQVLTNKELSVPHPKMHLRSFVLKGLCQLDPKLIHPIIKESVSELALRLNGGNFLLNSDLPQLISIAGIIGVGKTTLAKGLSDVLGCELILEAYDTNPFLADVYAGRKELSLGCQLYFLTSRVEQLRTGRLGKGRLFVADYVFLKELIYARQLLDKDQLDVYGKIHKDLVGNVAKPVLVVYLTGSVQV